MDRTDKALHFIDLSGRGIEIGPSYSPLVPKASGARVETVDHADQLALVEKYQSYGLDAERLARIEPVDHLWHGGSLLDVISEQGVFDYIVASHFIEHTVDLVQFVNDCEVLLNASGRLALVVPDKRFCFDRFQPLSSIGDVIDAHHSPLAFHTAGTLLDHQAYACKRGESIGWSSSDTEPIALQFPHLEGAADVIERGLKQEDYQDIHRWKFTPGSFRLLIDDLRRLGYHDMGIVGSFDTDGFEFYVTLGNGVGGVELERSQALLDIERELAAVATGPGAGGAHDDGSALQLRVRALEESLLSMEASRSWRVTRPLRRLQALRRRLRSR
jgi:hypothetical protein